MGEMWVCYRAKATFESKRDYMREKKLHSNLAELGVCESAKSLNCFSIILDGKRGSACAPNYEACTKMRDAFAVELLQRLGAIYVALEPCWRHRSRSPSALVGLGILKAPRSLSSLTFSAQADAMASATQRETINLSTNSVLQAPLGLSRFLGRRNPQ